jgi:hypothetical protein
VGGISDAFGVRTLNSATFYREPQCFSLKALAAPRKRQCSVKNQRIGSNRINTDIPGDRAVGKSIFRNLTKGQKVTTRVDPSGTIRRFTSDGTQIRFGPDGKTNLDLPRGPVGREDVHIKPPE